MSNEKQYNLPVFSDLFAEIAPAKPRVTGRKVPKHYKPRYFHNEIGDKVTWIRVGRRHTFSYRNRGGGLTRWEAPTVASAEATWAEIQEELGGGEWTESDD